MAQQIVQIQQFGDALRNTGYKNISSAVSEIIDNSVEAGAKNIFILLTEILDSRTGRKSVRQIAILDNGTGMDFTQLGSCLGIGFTTRVERKGMGRFGVGLPQASLHVCPRVDVYSWQNGYSNCSKVWLDIDKVKNGEQNQIDDPIVCSIENRYKNFINYRLGEKVFDFGEHGTMVVWKDCDRVSPKSAGFLMRDLEFALGQKFRYLINKKSLNIYLINTDNVEDYRKVYPNDPLLLMENNLYLGDSNNPTEVVEKNQDRKNAEPIFEAYGNEQYSDGIIPYPIKYINKDGGISSKNIEIKFSKVKDKFYTQDYVTVDPGSTRIGRYVSQLVGISIVRAEREIDFGKFDFFNDINEPQHRWWGCEIRFDPILDEVFGVANNKQSVELKKIDASDYLDDEVKPVWLQIYKIISSTISEMYNKNRVARQGSRGKNVSITPSEDIINSVEQNNSTNSLSQKIKESTSKDELLEKSKNFIKDRDDTEDNIEEKALAYLDNKVNINYKRLGKSSSFFDRSSELGTVSLTINMDHVFYKNFLEKIWDDADSKTTFELFVGSFAKSADELDISQQDQNDLLIQEWNDKLRNYVNKQIGKI